jgi:FkbM family methyltransferase
MDFLSEISKRINIRGIIQVGANVGQECTYLKQFTNNIICFEPIPSVFQILKSNNPDVTCFNFALGDKNEVKPMHIASNNGESSSFLKPLNHLSYYDVTFEQKIDLEIRRFDTLDIDLAYYNVLVSDTQGYELNVLVGFGDLLNKIDAIVVEYIDSELYENDSKLNSISIFLSRFGFNLVTYSQDGIGWGNACYIKK